MACGDLRLAVAERDFVTVKEWSRFDIQLPARSENGHIVVWWSLDSIAEDIDASSIATTRRQDTHGAAIVSEENQPIDDIAHFQMSVAFAMYALKLALTFGAQVEEAKRLRFHHCADSEVSSTRSTRHSWEGFRYFACISPRAIGLSGVFGWLLSW